MIIGGLVRVAINAAKSEVWVHTTTIASRGSKIPVDEAHRMLNTYANAIWQGAWKRHRTDGTITALFAQPRTQGVLPGLWRAGTRPVYY
jgi:hypothetical protein